MKKILFPIGLLALLTVVSSCGPAAAGKKVAQKYCECSEMKDVNAKNDCSEEYHRMYNDYHRQYLADPEDLKEFMEAFESNLSCIE
ncbi:MAG: hypothetical protein J6W45_08760 [Bacteroidales bacterium]|nr:hypothetical protein [Bacteroidales bacterium]